MALTTIAGKHNLKHFRKNQLPPGCLPPDVNSTNPVGGHSLPSAARSPFKPILIPELQTILETPFTELGDDDPLSHHVVCVNFIAHFKGEHAVTPSTNCSICNSHIATQIFNQQIAIVANQHNLDHKGQSMHDHVVTSDNSAFSMPAVVARQVIGSHTCSQLSTCAPRPIADIPTEQLLARYEQLQCDIRHLHASVVTGPQIACPATDEIMSSQQAVSHYCSTLLANPVTYSGDALLVHDSLDSTDQISHPIHDSLSNSFDASNEPMSSQQAIAHHFAIITGSSSDHIAHSIVSSPQPTDNG